MLALCCKIEERCRGTLIADTQAPIGIAIGFSRFEREKDLQFSDVFKRADAAMYENKRGMKSGT